MFGDVGKSWFGVYKYFKVSLYFIYKLSNSDSKSVSLQLECEREKKHSETWTDNQIAKKLSVGVGTVACYNKIMNSKDKMLNLLFIYWI